MEIINRIAEVQGVDITGTLQREEAGGRLGAASMVTLLTDYGGRDGFQVITTDTTYFILIDNDQHCCEDYGYICSEDDLDYFVSAELYAVKLTDIGLNERMLSKCEYLDCGGIVFVDFITSKGTLQFAVYNGHNGYYGHSIIITKGSKILKQEVL